MGYGYDAEADYAYGAAEIGDDSGGVHSGNSSQSSQHSATNTGGGASSSFGEAYSGDAAAGTQSSGMFSDGTSDGAYGGGDHGYGYGSKSDGSYGSLTPGEAEAAAGEGGGGGGSSVVCTELYRQHMISDVMYDADLAYGKTLDPDILHGYHFWAKPLVRLMRRHYAVTIIIKVLALPWIKEIAYRQAGLEPGSVLGMFMLFCGLPLCKGIGVVRKIFEPWWAQMVKR
jgi:hypothetical protein